MERLSVCAVQVPSIDVSNMPMPQETASSMTAAAITAIIAFLIILPSTTAIVAS